MRGSCSLESDSSSQHVFRTWEGQLGAAGTILARNRKWKDLLGDD
jgi:hypothetical protein